MRVTMRTAVYGLLALALVMAVAGCGSRRPMEFGMTLQNSAGMDMKMMETAILQGGARTNWELTPVEEGRIEGVLNTRGHRIEVSITYDVNSYHIRYTRGEDTETGTTVFYKRYNTWIKKLDQSIRRVFREYSRA